MTKSDKRKNTAVGEVDTAKGIPVVVGKIVESTADGMVVHVPAPDMGATVMQEDPPDTLAQTKVAIKENLKTRLLKMAGRYMFEVKPELDAFIKSGEIGSYRLLIPGESYDSDFVSNRVQLMVLGNECKDVFLG